MTSDDDKGSGHRWVTPPTKADFHHLPADDPAVVALTSPAPDPIDPLPPLDDEFVTPVHIIDLANLDPKQVNARLERAAPQKTTEQRLDEAEQEIIGLRKDVENLTAMFKMYLYGKPLP